jgi:hypothetical protein
MGCVSEPQQTGTPEEAVAQKENELASTERFRTELDELACMLAAQQVEAQRERDLRRKAEEKLALTERDLEAALDDKADLRRRLDEAYLDIAALQRSRAAPTVARVR